jgi:anti-sigma B factor antagonist
MQIKKNLDGTTLTVILSGELDAIAAKELNNELANIDDVTELIFDLAGLEYIASTGLRSLFILQKKMNKQGSMKIKNVRPEIKEILELTRFIDFLTIEG